MTKQQKENITRHVAGLRKIDEGMFNMALFCEEDAYKEPNECGTSACSLGYAPQTLSFGEKEWEKYYSKGCNVVGWDFCSISKEYFGVVPDSIEWYFCFSPEWVDRDNTIEGACRRLEYVRDGGKVPMNMVALNEKLAAQ